MKKIILSFLIFCTACKHEAKHTFETDDINFYNGEILLPDYAHSDTLMVVNADSINWCMANYDIASDGDINDVLHAYCKSSN